MNFKFLFILILLSTSTALFAGSYGFVYQGQTYYQFKDGEKVDTTPFEHKGRAPASTDSTVDFKESLLLHFVEDEFARCYFWGTETTKTFKKAKKEGNIHCLKLKDLKE